MEWGKKACKTPVLIPSLKPYQKEENSPATDLVTESDTNPQN